MVHVSKNHPAAEVLDMQLPYAASYGIVNHGIVKQA